MQVKDFMRKDIITFQLDDTLEKASQQMVSQKLYGAPVVNENNILQGIFTRPHLLRAFMHKCPFNTPISDLMQTTIVSLKADDTFNKVIKIFVETNYSYFPIVNEHNELEGIILAADILQLGAQEFYKVFGSQKLDYSGNAFIGIDAKGYIRSVSKTAQNVLGEKADSVINKHIVETIPIMENLAQDILKDATKARELFRQLSIAQRRIDYYQSTIETMRQSKYTFDNIIGMSNKMKKIRSIAAQAAKTSSTILIRGESGTGKELLAHAIHNASPRCNQPFIMVNCAAIPEMLIESELFGYCEGAFTGALKGGKPGKFELAHGGTIFLDEIGDLPYSAQAKILRVLQEFEFERLGGTKTINVDVRVIAATNRDLKELIKGGNFRKDLFYRLNVVEIKTPSLKERSEDIDYLTDYLIEKICDRLNIYSITISDDARIILRSYDFPGNVRELENILERAINFAAETGVILPEHLISITDKPSFTIPFPTNVNNDYGYNEQPITDLKNIVDLAEKNAIKKALEITNGNKKQAAEILNIHRTHLYKKLDKHGIS
ncbi:MAG: sigma 54-interacting transcriptional regulator [Syntrophomonadaceae bacterium]|nr:sigma 54-interacting transcriptional regulator [Syntrophomonadaceae bacterium]